MIIEKYSFIETYGRFPDDEDLRHARGEILHKDLPPIKRVEYLKKAGEGYNWPYADIKHFLTDCGLIIRNKFVVSKRPVRVTTKIDNNSPSAYYTVERNGEQTSIVVKYVDSQFSQLEKTLILDFDIGHPKVSAKTFKDKPKVADTIFPKNVYEKAPDVYRRVYDDWIDSIDNPIAAFAFVTIEGAMQTLVGKDVKTPQKGRTCATHSICASESTAGKDNSGLDPLLDLKREILEYSTGNIAVSTKCQKLASGIASITNDTAFLKAADEWQGNFLWMSTEASEIMQIISVTDGKANQGSALAVALNHSYDGKEVLGKRKASEKVSSILEPCIPIVWLTQPEFIHRTLTPELLSKGTLGRFDYIFDYSPPDRAESMIWSMPTAEDNPGEVKQYNIFQDSTLDSLVNAISKLPRGRILPTEKARDYFAEVDDELLVKRDYGSQQKKVFMSRTAMSVEKRLTAWVAMDGRNVIEVADVEAILPWFEYQVAMRDKVFDAEVDKKTDISTVIKAVIKEAKVYGKSSLPSQASQLSLKKKAEYEHLRRAGIVSCGDLIFFLRKGKYSHLDLKTASGLQRELEALNKQGAIICDKRPGFRGKFVWMPV